jgi:hypothetical protein
MNTHGNEPSPSQLRFAHAHAQAFRSSSHTTASCSTVRLSTRLIFGSWVTRSQVGIVYMSRGGACRGRLIGLVRKRLHFVVTFTAGFVLEDSTIRTFRLLQFKLLHQEALKLIVVVVRCAYFLLCPKIISMSNDYVSRTTNITYNLLVTPVSQLGYICL